MIVGSNRFALVIVLVVHFGISLSAQSSKKEPRKMSSIDLRGGWVGCDQRGNYVEASFTDYLSFSARDSAIDMGRVVPYAHVLDSVYYYNFYIGKHLVDYLEVENRDRIKLVNTFSANSFQYVTTLRLQRVDEEPLYPMSYDMDFLSPLDSFLLKHYEYMFEVRKELFKCPD